MGPLQMVYGWAISKNLLAVKAGRQDHTCEVDYIQGSFWAACGLLTFLFVHYRLR